MFRYLRSSSVTNTNERKPLSAFVLYGYNSFNTDTFLKRWKWGVIWSILGKATDLGTQNLIYEIYKDKSAPESNHIPSRYLANQQLLTTDQKHAYQYIYLLIVHKLPTNQHLMTTNQLPANHQSYRLLTSHLLTNSYWLLTNPLLTNQVIDCHQSPSPTVTKYWPVTC